MTELTEYAGLLADIKTRIQAAQTRALLAVNTELVRLYWEIGRLLNERQMSEGWGAAVIPRLAADIRDELPEVKGFSERNLKRMLAFFRAYPDAGALVPQAVAPMLVKQAEKMPQPDVARRGRRLATNRRQHDRCPMSAR